MLAALLNVVRAMFGFTTDVAVPTANLWLRIALGAIFILFILLPASLFGFGVMEWQAAIPWIIACPVLLVLALVVWQPAALVAFFAPWGVGARVRASLAFLILCGIILAFIAGWVPWSEAPGFVPWFLIGVLGYVMTFMTSTNRFVIRARQALLMALVVMMVATCYHAGWFKEVGVSTSINFFDQASPICYKSGWGLQCFGTEYVDGDGVTSITYDILPLAGQKPAYTGRWNLGRDAATGTCRGEGNLLSQGNDSGLEWEVEILPTACESLARFNAKARGTSSEGKKTLQNISFRKE